jgi:hypothetical protein
MVTQMDNRNIVYAFQNVHGLVSIVNYNGPNVRVNTFLHLFDAWNGNGNRKLSADNNHVEVWFEWPAEMWNMLHTPMFKKAFERMDAQLVFECPEV